MKFQETMILVRRSAYGWIGNSWKKSGSASFYGMPVRRDSRMSGHRIGVWESGKFYRHFLGNAKGPQSQMEWLNLPDSYLAVAANGCIFKEGSGSFLEVRSRLKAGHPEDVRIKKMVARAANMSQSGQYNLPRSVRRGEYVAAGLALAEFVRHGMVMIYLLNHRYAPFYKWMHRGLGELPILGTTQKLFAQLMDPCPESLFWEQKQELIETICGLISAEWQRQGLIGTTDPFLQNSLDELMKQIQDPQIAVLPWLYG